MMGSKRPGFPWVIPRPLRPCSFTEFTWVSTRMRTRPTTCDSGHRLYFGRTKGNRCPNNAWLSLGHSSSYAAVLIRKIYTGCQCVCIRGRPLMNQVIICISALQRGASVPIMRGYPLVIPLPLRLCSFAEFARGVDVYAYATDHVWIRSSSAFWPYKGEKMSQ